LSWSYQGAARSVHNSGNPLRLYTSYNLHPMGFSNCALIEAAYRQPEGITLAIIGDGSLPMNCQELAHLKSRTDLKLIVIDNSGYGIIRQTQNDFYESIQLGSSFMGPSALPKFDVESIVNGFGLECTNIGLEATEDDINNFFLSEKNVLIVKCPFEEKVEVDFYE